MKRVLIMCLCLLVTIPVLSLNKAIENQVISVASTATKLPTTPLVGRKFVLVQNIGSQIVYLGKSDVTADTTAATGEYTSRQYAPG